ncbi:MAG: proline--tRNA ligase [archaeon]|nr:proline--tRNA ligase [archaeon]
MGKKKELGKKLPSREENFTDWLNEVILRTEFVDYRYNLKGCGVWRGYGFKLRKNVNQILRDLHDNTDIPHEEHLFPLLVPEDQFMKEAEHVKGFEEEVYWVTHGGTKPLDVKLALRPTSETVMYPMYAKWIRSHQDLPLKAYQIVSTFRYEGKNTRPFIRVREIMNFKEAHTVHSSAKNAENQILEALYIYRTFFESLGLSYIINNRPKWDTFPGADYTIAFDIIFPGRHRALQVGTVHNLGQTFAKTFNITFENLNKENEYGYQTCYGISERAIASVVGMHGDDKGMSFPPNIAPIQIVIIPILFKESAEEKILKECKKIQDKLKVNGFRVDFDDRKIKPGSKFYHWEEKGVPLRLEIGPKDLEKKQVVLVRRDNKEKIFVPSDEKVLTDKINEIFDLIFENMKKKVAEHTKNCMFRTDDMDEALEFVESDKGVVEIPFCGSEECAGELEKRVEGLTFLGVPGRYHDFLNYDNKHKETGEMNAESPNKEELFCLVCSKKVDKYWTIGRSF